MIQSPTNIYSPLALPVRMIPNPAGTKPPFVRLGENLKRIIEDALRERFNYRTQDNRRFAPLTLGAQLVVLDNVPTLFALVVNPQTLYHFTSSKMMDESFIAGLQLQIGRRVVVFEHQESMPGLPPGILYLVVLRELPRLESGAGTLPRTVELDLSQHADQRDRLTVPVGVGERGPVWKSLIEQGHTLIAGTTGAGKSSWVHSALAALLTLNTRESIQVALLDPKRGELGLWAKAEHVWQDGYAYELSDIHALLMRLADEMNRRGDLRANSRVRDISEYNKLANQKLPYFLVVIDEYADLTKSRETVELVDLLARRGRSEGIIVWLATQSATVAANLPSSLKGNLGSRIIFRMEDADLARRVMCPEAHTIDRKGRLYARVGTTPVLLQGYFMSTNQIIALADSIERTGDSGIRLDLTEPEKRLVAWAFDKNGGYVRLADFNQFGIGHQAARKRLAVWRTRGWVVKDGKRQNARRLAGDLETVWQFGKFGEFGSLANAQKQSKPSGNHQSAKYPELLSDAITQIPDVLERIKTQMDALVAKGHTTQDAYSQVVSTL